MHRVGAYEAKTKFSELLSRAERGEEIEITKNGRTVARLVPAESHQQALARELVERWRQEPAADRTADLDLPTIKQWMNEGRPGCD